MPMPSARFRSLFVVALACLVATAAAWAILGAPTPGIDDADITIVYGRNLRSGDGFVYFPGGERVEGATSLLWTLICALVGVVPVDPRWVLTIVTLAMTCGTVLALIDGLSTLGLATRFAVALSVGWALCQPAFFAWSGVTLMETSLWCLLVVLFVASCARTVTSDGAKSPWILPGIAAAMTLTRPESTLLVPGVLALTAAIILRTSGWRPALRNVGPALLSFALVFTLLVGWRLWYFGYPWPNTYYAKASGHFRYDLGVGYNYVKLFLATHPVEACLLGILAALSLPKLLWLVRGQALERAETSLLIFAGAVAIGFGLPVATAGDSFGSYRPLQSFLLLLIAPAAFLLGQRVKAWNTLAADVRVAIGVTLFVLAAGAWYQFRGNHNLAGEFKAAAVGRRVGASLTRTLGAGADPTLGVLGAGGVAWTYPGGVLDLMGLNWTEMAHSRGDRRGLRHGHGAFDPRVFWRKAPEIMVLDLQDGAYCSAETPETTLHTRAVLAWMKGLTISERFKRAYQAGCLGSGRDSVAGFFRKDWLLERQLPNYRALPGGPPRAEVAE